MFCIFQLNSIGGECGLTNQELAADRRSRPHERARLNGVRCRVLGASFRQWIPRKADWKPRAPGHLKSIRWKLLFVEAVGLQSYRELRRRGVCHNLPGSTVKSAHGPWHLSRSHAGTVLRHSGITTALRTKSSPSRTAWYVIRMPGGVGGVAPRGAVLT